MSVYITIFIIFLILYFTRVSSIKGKKGKSYDQKNPDTLKRDEIKSTKPQTVSNQEIIKDGYMNLNGVYVKIQDADKLNF